jgi:hypothetical protein
LAATCSQVRKSAIKTSTEEGQPSVSKRAAERAITKSALEYRERFIGSA